MEYEQYDILNDARLVHNYLTGMVDANMDYLPYWLVAANENPASARHVRVDDAELVASWYEALVCTQDVLATDDGADVLSGFKRHLLRSWGQHGLRFHEKYPWTHTMHCSFHEMGYVLPAMVRWHLLEPDNNEVEKRLNGLIHGLRGLVQERKVITFWSGDFPFEEPIYEFPNDVYLQEGGFDLTRVTGRGEQAIRNALMLHGLVQAYQFFGNEEALDLARGLANHLLGISRYFNWKGEFFGHVHSATVVAAGLVLLGRLTGQEKYTKRGKEILRYVLSLSSTFGWVPEYAQWHPMSEEHCETCCIRDVILCCFEMIDAGIGPNGDVNECWDIINRFARNQLTEQQIKDRSFVAVDNSIPDTEEVTYKDIDKRIVGGYSGGGEPNSISLAKFRSIAGCCVGTAPQALHQIYHAIIREDGGRIRVNLPIAKDDPRAKVRIGYPNEGWLEVRAQKAGDYALRVLPFMDKDLTLTVDGQRRSIRMKDGCADIGKVNKGGSIRLEHDIVQEVRNEFVADREYRVTWKGCDVVDISPHGEPLRLYQRQVGVAKEVPPPPARGHRAPERRELAGPTNQKK